MGPRGAGCRRRWLLLQREEEEEEQKVRRPPGPVQTQTQVQVQMKVQTSPPATGKTGAMQGEKEEEGEEGPQCPLLLPLPQQLQIPTRQPKWQAGRARKPTRKRRQEGKEKRKTWIPTPWKQKTEAAPAQAAPTPEEEAAVG